MTVEESKSSKAKKENEQSNEQSQQVEDEYHGHGHELSEKVWDAKYLDWDTYRMAPCQHNIGLCKNRELESCKMDCASGCESARKMLEMYRLTQELGWGGMKAEEELKKKERGCRAELE